MLSGLRIFLLLPVAALVGCGATSPTAGTSSTLSTGNYVLTVTPAASPGTMLAGALSVQGSGVTGVFVYSNPQAPSCGTQTVSVTGSINASNVLTLTSSSFAGSVATFAIQLPLSTNSAGATLANGTAQIVGGTCALASSPLVAAYILPQNGTWTGTLAGPVTGAASLVVAQSTANTIGQFSASGSIAFTAPTCTLSPAVAVSGVVSGYNLQLANAQSTLTITANSASSPVTLNMTIVGSLLGCPAGSYTGTITH